MSGRAKAGLDIGVVWNVEQIDRDEGDEHADHLYGIDAFPEEDDGEDQGNDGKHSGQRRDHGGSASMIQGVEECEISATGGKTRGEGKSNAAGNVLVIAEAWRCDEQQ